ncbi:MAG: hypothetical protein ACOC28_06440 [Alkalispirochaetaceae bacterium]
MKAGYLTIMVLLIALLTATSLRVEAARHALASVEILIDALSEGHTP